MRKFWIIMIIIVVLLALGGSIGIYIYNLKNYKKVNQKGIQIVNFSLLISVISKVVIYEILSQWGRSFL